MYTCTFVYNKLKLKWMLCTVPECRFNLFVCLYSIRLSVFPYVINTSSIMYRRTVKSKNLTVSLMVKRYHAVSNVLRYRRYPCVECLPFEMLVETYVPHGIIRISGKHNVSLKHVYVSFYIYLPNIWTLTIHWKCIVQKRLDIKIRNTFN